MSDPRQRNATRALVVVGVAALLGLGAKGYRVWGNRLEPFTPSGITAAEQYTVNMPGKPKKRTTKIPGTDHKATEFESTDAEGRAYHVGSFPLAGEPFEYVDRDELLDAGLKDSMRRRQAGPVSTDGRLGLKGREYDFTVTVSGKKCEGTCVLLIGDGAFFTIEVIGPAPLDRRRVEQFLTSFRPPG